ncbi:MAG TPA: hypothetical protein VM223_27035, partial [Planctomycetota bacterium]|nr:hypothetical protein [Planctomycetota bacterium]
MSIGYPLTSYHQRDGDFSVVNPAFGIAQCAGDSAYPSLWYGHLGSWIMWAPDSVTYEAFGHHPSRGPHRGVGTIDRGGNYPTIGASPVGRCVTFDGTSYIKWVGSATNSAFFKTGNAVTVAAHVKYDNASGDVCILASD